MIRASVSLRVPIQFMERNRITQGPIVADFMYKFHSCTVFARLGIQQGLHQLLLDPESRKTATFGTPWENMRLKRLIFGSKASLWWSYRIFGDTKMPQPTGWYPAGKKKYGGGQQGIGSRRAESSGLCNHIQPWQVPVCSRGDRVLWTQIHERRIKAKLRENQCCKKSSSPKSKEAVISFLCTWPDMYQNSSQDTHYQPHPCESWPTTKMQSSNGEQKRMKHLRSWKQA